MISIVLEAKSKDTPETHFFNALVKHYYPSAIADKDYQVIYANGKDNLPNLVPLLQSNTEAGILNVLVFDADFPESGGGCAIRRKELLDRQSELNVSFGLFLYPNNQDDGDAETLMEEIACKDRHRRFFCCFNKYEECISQEKDDQGQQKYLTPNRKGKLHTYINSMRLTNKQKRNLGRGDWLFEDSEYWNMESDAVQPLISFLNDYLPK